MAFNTGKSSKETFKALKKMTPQMRVEEASKLGASYLSSLTPIEFAELFPKYYQRGLPDVSGFREAISKKSRQKQDDINYGLSMGATSIKEAERLGSGRSSRGDVNVIGGTAGGYGSLSRSQVAAMIKEEAAKRGIDPKVALAIANSEGLNNYRSTANGRKWGMDKEPSYGPFQLLMGKGTGGPTGMGDDFLAKTGIDPSKDNSPESIKRQIQFALDHAKTNGWRAWYGRFNAGVGVNEGLDWNGKYTPGQYMKEAETTNVSGHSAKSGGFFGGGEQCVDLSKHFSGLGPAGKWTFNNNSKIVPGSVIATTNYGKGSTPGGVMAKDMPDRKSHYHTGIALTTPNANGDVLILEQFAGHGARVATVNINNYRGSGERMAVVDGGEPSAQSMRAIEVAKGLADKDQLTWMQESGTPTAAPVAAGAPVNAGPNATADVKPAQQAAVAKPTLTTNAAPPAYPEQQQQAAPQETAKVEKPDKSKKTTESYKFDPDKYYNEVNSKHPEAKFFGYDRETIMRDTYKGFEEAQAAGAIKWNRKTNEIQILDPNHEQVQKIYQDMKSNNIDKDTFMTKTEAGGAGDAKPKKSTASVEKAPSVFIPDTRKDIGAITGQWETGKYGDKAKFSVGTISSGKDDPGGVSYGQHQLSSKKGTMADFLKSDEAKPFAAAFGRAKPGSSAFNKIYSQVASTHGEAFAAAQHSYLDRTHYQPFIKKAAQLGYDVKDPRVQEAIWGGGIQFRNHMHKILSNPTAMASVGKSPEAQVTALAQAKQQAAPKIQNRYSAEAQAILGHVPEGQFKVANVMDMSKYTDYSAEQKSKQAAFIAQQNKTQMAAAKPEAPIRSAAIPLISASSAAASTNNDGHPVTPDVSTKESFERMRHMTAPESLKSAPQNPEPTTQRERHSSINQIPESPQNPVSINPLENRGASMQPSPSLARAMDKIRGVESSHYTSLNKTSISG